MPAPSVERSKSKGVSGDTFWWVEERVSAGCMWDAASKLASRDAGEGGMAEGEVPVGTDEFIGPGSMLCWEFAPREPKRTWFSLVPPTAERASSISIPIASSFMAVFPSTAVPGMVRSGVVVGGENSPSMVSFVVDSTVSPKRSVMDISISISRSSSIGLSAELPSVESKIMSTPFVPALISVTVLESSGTVRSISRDLFTASSEEPEAKAIKSGGRSLAVEGRADLGASVTGEARPLNNEVASSAVIRREMAERSSFGGGRGRCKEERKIEDWRRPGGIEEPMRTEVEGSTTAIWVAGRLSVVGA